MIHTAKGFRAELDLKLSEKLSSLKACNAVVYFPFFANTFPLAFHYHDCLQASDDALPKDIGERIKLIAWGDETRLLNQDSEDIVVCYSSELDVKLVVEKNVHVTWVSVTEFLPRWIFSEFNLKVSAERRLLAANVKRQNDHDVQFQDVANALKREFDSFEIFSEIPDQAEALFPELLDLKDEKSCVKVIRTDAANLLFAEDQLCENTLRLFLYGAPLTSYFLRKPQRYIAFKVGQLGEAQEVFKTVVAIKGGSETQRNEMRGAIAEYHFDLYKAAQAEKVSDYGFRAVQHAYNRVARLLQHRSSFASSYQYAKCLAEHHKGVLPTELAAVSTLRNANS